MITTTFCHRFQERFRMTQPHTHTKCSHKEELYYQHHRHQSTRETGLVFTAILHFLVFLSGLLLYTRNFMHTIHHNLYLCYLWYSPQSFSMDGWVVVVEGIFSVFFAKKCSSHSLTVELCSPTAKTCNIFSLSILSFSLNKRNFPRVIHFPESVCVCSTPHIPEPWNFAPVKCNILRFKLCGAKQ